MTSRTFNSIGEWLAMPGPRFPRPIRFHISRFTARASRFKTWRRGILALFSSHLKHGPGGHLIHNAAGNLIHDCAPAGGGCPCIDSTACGFCPGDTPTQFHVTFAGITLCTGCVGCPATGLSMKIDAGSAVNGTYLLSRNGACAWTAFASSVPCTATEFASTDCTGASAGFGFAIQQVRINATQFRLQITDSSNTILLFDATITSAACCVSYTVGNALTACACAGTGPTIYALGTGGTAMVTPC